jgi:hypothetical protein
MAVADFNRTMIDAMEGLTGRHVVAAERDRDLG